MRRNVEAETNTLHPGMVDQKALRQKIANQLKVDLTDDELVHIHEAPLDSHDNLTEEVMEEIMDGLDSTKPCEVQIRQLGKYVAKISLAGGYTVPLKFAIEKR